jgi:hypothetical protein
MINKHSKPVLTSQSVCSPFDLARHVNSRSFQENYTSIAALERHISMGRGNEVAAVLQI